MRSHIVIATIAILCFCADPAVGKKSVVKKTSVQTLAIACDKLLSQPAWDLFHPVWKETTADVSAHDRQLLAYIARDPDHRLDRAFPISPELSRRVSFWLSVYAFYPEHTRVVHDRNDPSLVYGYIDFSPVYRLKQNMVHPERLVQAIEEEIVQQLKLRIGRALDVIGPKLELEEELAIKALLVRRDRKAKDIAHLLRNIRTQTGQREHFRQALLRAHKLLPAIETTFHAKGLPVGLGRIPFVESSFNPKATSRTGAFGIWQFTSIAVQDFFPRGKKSSRDFATQTLAAANLLRFYRSRLPDWSTAITAYNAGVGRLARLTRQIGAKSITELLHYPAAAEELGFAGQNFYAEFLAASLVEAYKTHVYFPWMKTGQDVALACNHPRR